MISVKAEIYEGLSKALETSNVSVYDYYPDEIESFPLVVYLEESNIPYEIVDDRESMSTVLYRVDIWSKDSTTELAQKVNDVFMKFGIKRTHCSDAPDISGLRHKLMKFEGIIDHNTRLVYSQRFNN